MALKSQLENLNSSIAGQNNKTLFEPLANQADYLLKVVDDLIKANPAININQVNAVTSNVDALQRAYDNLWIQIGNEHELINYSKLSTSTIT